jgi:hypothetical protein
MNRRNFLSAAAPAAAVAATATFALAEPISSVD